MILYVLTPEGELFHGNMEEVYSRIKPNDIFTADGGARFTYIKSQIGISDLGYEPKELAVYRSLLS